MNMKHAGEAMTRHLLTIHWNEPMETAFKRMQKNHLRHLPVLNDSGEVVGMLSDRDVQRSMISEIKHEGGNLSSEVVEFDPEAKVRDYMGWPVQTVDQDADLVEVVEKMLNEKISSLLVRCGKKSVGIITSDDLLRVLKNLLKDPMTPSRWTLGTILAESGNRFEGILI